MKRRLGFVSNSSSSSFMIMIARVSNEGVVRKFLESIDIEDKDYNVSIQTPDEIVSKTDKWSDVYYGDNKFSVECYRGDEVSVSEKDVHWMFDKILTVHFCNDEGDSSFLSSEWGEIDYDIDLSFLPKEQIALYEKIDKVEGVSNVSKCFGAARNG